MLLVCPDSLVPVALPQECVEAWSRYCQFEGLRIHHYGGMSFGGPGLGPSPGIPAPASFPVAATIVKSADS